MPINGILYVGGTGRQRHGNSVFFYMGPYVFTYTVDSGFIVPTPIGHRSLVFIDWLEGAEGCLTYLSFSRITSNRKCMLFGDKVW